MLETVRVAFVLALSLTAGCIQKPLPPPKPPDEKPPITVAVIEFGDRGREAENGCVMAVLEAGFRAVDRAQLDQHLPTDDDIDYQKLGHALGCDLIIDGGIARGSTAKTAPAPRLVSTRSGDVLAISPAKGRVDRNFKIGQRVCGDLLKQLP